MEVVAVEAVPGEVCHRSVAALLDRRLDDRPELPGGDPRTDGSDRRLEGSRGGLDEGRVVAEVDGHGGVGDVAVYQDTKVDLDEVAPREDPLVTGHRGIVGRGLVEGDVEGEGKERPLLHHHSLCGFNHLKEACPLLHEPRALVEHLSCQRPGFAVGVVDNIIHDHKVSSSSYWVNRSKSVSVTAPISSRRTPPVPG
ncbi:MAG: hypothetical protein BWX50_01481 [Euryarchaeota archaeon ADurb.Bin009]|nr:MAG: hypothetical protein BWX50_01481 [Euryarchaeota archaeon ADurb.Bin009]